jgi:hypothetical protein
LIHETVCTIATEDRYIAHVEMDRQWKALDRKDRPWSYAIYDFNGAMLCLMRSTQPDVGLNWRPLALPAHGEMVSGLVIAGPKKPESFDAFRFKDDFAENFFLHRLKPLGIVNKLSVADARTVRVDKPSHRFSMPTRCAMFEIELQHPEVYASMLMRGIGGARAFGVGQIIPVQSRLYDVISSLA